VGRIAVPQDYYDKHRRETRSHRGVVLAVGPPALTGAGVEIAPEFRVGDIVHYVFSLVGSEKSRAGVWEGGRCVWVAQEEIIGLETYDE
jgi:hypothetical protein